MMSYTVRALLLLLVTQFLVTICLAVEPQYLVPTAEGKSTSREPSNVCDNSKFNVVGGGDILVEDCGMYCINCPPPHPPHCYVVYER